MTAAHTLRLVLGDQLHPGHSWFSQVDEQVVYVLMEVRQETDYVLHHAQKILAIFAGMRDFARYLRRVCRILCKRTIHRRRKPACP